MTIFIAGLVVGIALTGIFDAWVLAQSIKDDSGWEKLVALRKKHTDK